MIANALSPSNRLDAGGHLIQNRAQGIDVGAPIHAEFGTALSGTCK